MTTPSRFVKSAIAQTLVDVSTASGAFVDLLTVNITMEQAGFLETIFTCATSNDFFLSAQNSFRLVIDGVVQHATACFSGGATVTQSCALADRDARAAGAHVVTIQWRVGAGTGYIRPVSQPNLEHATLLVNEVRT